MSFNLLLTFGFGLAALWGLASSELRFRNPIKPKALTLDSRLLAVAVLGGMAGWALFPSNLGVLISIPTVLGYKAMIKNDLAKPNIAAQRDFPMLLELLAGLVNSGLPLRLALSEVVKIVGGASTKPLAQVLAAIEIGCDDTEAWQQISDDPIWADLAHDLARSSSSGSACAPVLLATAATARQTLASEALVAARAVGVRSSLPLVCCYLPAFLLVGVVPIIGGLVGQYLG